MKTRFFIDGKVVHVIELPYRLHVGDVVIVPVDTGGTRHATVSKLVFDVYPGERLVDCLVHCSWGGHSDA